MDWIVSRSQRIQRMAPRDQLVWSQFASSLTSHALHVFYDLRLGDGRPPTVDMTPDEIALYHTLTQYRIDVVIIAENMVYLVEVKDRVTPALIGQMMVYQNAVRKSPLTGVPHQLLCICAANDAEVDQICASYGWPVIQIDDTQYLADMFGPVVNHQGASL